MSSVGSVPVSVPARPAQQPQQAQNVDKPRHQDAPRQAQVTDGDGDNDGSRQTAPAQQSQPRVDIKA